MKNNNTWKWIARMLAGCLILIMGWFGTQVWSQQKDIVVLQTYIISIDKSLAGMQAAMREDIIRDKQRDSILQDIALKVDLMFDGR